MRLADLQIHITHRSARRRAANLVREATSSYNC